MGPGIVYETLNMLVNALHGNARGAFIYENEKAILGRMNDVKPKHDVEALQRELVVSD